MDELVGYVESITFQSEETGFTVAKIKKNNSIITIVGTLPLIQPGQTVRCKGKWKNHPSHGKQFEVSSIEIETPADVVGIKKYLSSGLIKGIGPSFAGRIVDKFGKETLNIIDQTPEKLLEVDGLGPKKVESIKECWSNQRQIRDVMVFLQTYSVTPSLAQKIFKKYGNKSISIVKENPFRLAHDIFGIGFKTADTIAHKMGIPKDATQRIDAGIDYVLTQLSQDGHTCYPIDEFLKESEKILEVQNQKIQDQLNSLQTQEYIELKDCMDGSTMKPFIWSKKLFLSELGIAKQIKRLKSEPASLRAVDHERAIQWVQTYLKINLAENQKKAVVQAVSEKIQIITGGPGTGKSTITKAIIAITSKLTDKILLAAPTGIAAQRMTEITGMQAKTIHSLLEMDFQKGGFKRNRENPLECDLIIIDEASMIDTYLMYSLLKAIPSEARVILIGDSNQLPSVGPGNVLKDMMASKCISVTILNEIFRQAEGSHIITNAHKVNKGIFPTLYNGKESDFFFIECEEPEEVQNTIIKLVAQRLPNKYHFNPIKDIQVLAPMKKGIIGTENLNLVLQQTLNPKSSSFSFFGNKYCLGDKVMQIRNNYKKMVFNGDIGTIKEIDEEERQLFVCFGDQTILYDFSELDELVLAYSISIHKFQGSECPCIVIPIHTSHFMMLRRNLLYTGITRGKKLVVLVGTKKAVAIAVHNDDVQKRYTALKQTLMEYV